MFQSGEAMNTLDASMQVPVPKLPTVGGVRIGPVTREDKTPENPSERSTSKEATRERDVTASADTERTAQDRFDRVDTGPGRAGSEPRDAAEKSSDPDAAATGDNRTDEALKETRPAADARPALDVEA